PCGTGLVERWHIENDIVEIAGFKVRHHVEEFLQTKLRRPRVRSPNRSQVQIIRSGGHRPVRLECCVQRVGWFAFEKRMHILRPKVHVNEKDLAVVRLRKRSSESGGQGRRSRVVGKSCNTDQLWFMRQVVKLEVQTEAVANCITVRPHEMTCFPGS